MNKKKIMKIIWQIIGIVGIMSAFWISIIWVTTDNLPLVTIGAIIMAFLLGKIFKDTPYWCDHCGQEFQCEDSHNIHTKICEINPKSKFYKG